MHFNEVIGIKEFNKDCSQITRRQAVRAIIIKDSKILMVQSNKGDYKLPGGGMEKGEDHKMTLLREVEEETGYMVEQVNEKIGVITQRNVDNYSDDKNAMFEMISYYYLCKLSGKKTSQRLDSYEAELGFSPVWINIDEAINQNENVIAQNNQNDWTRREVYVLKKLRNLYIDCDK